MIPLLYFRIIKIVNIRHQIRDTDIVVNTYGKAQNVQGLGEVPMYVEVKAKPEKFATLKHEEHKPLSLPPGLYRTRIVREFDHLSQRTRNVVD